MRFAFPGATVMLIAIVCAPYRRQRQYRFSLDRALVSRPNGDVRRAVDAPALTLKRPARHGGTLIGSYLTVAFPSFVASNNNIVTVSCHGTWENSHITSWLIGHVTTNETAIKVPKAANQDTMPK